MPPTLRYQAEPLHAKVPQTLHVKKHLTVIAMLQHAKLPQPLNAKAPEPLHANKRLSVVALLLHAKLPEPHHANKHLTRTLGFTG